MPHSATEVSPLETAAPPIEQAESSLPTVLRSERVLLLGLPAHLSACLVLIEEEAGTIFPLETAAGRRVESSSPAVVRSEHALLFKSPRDHSIPCICHGPRHKRSMTVVEPLHMEHAHTFNELND